MPEHQITMFQTQNSIAVVDLDIQEQLKKCIFESKQAVKLFEEWEFIKDYKYSALFEIDEVDSFIEKCGAIPNLHDQDEFENDRFDSVIGAPVRFEVNNLIILKFALKYCTVENFTGNEIFVKYSILVVFYKEQKTIEIRFDTLKRIFLTDKEAQTFYKNIIDDIFGFCQDEFGVSLAPINLDFITFDVKEQKGDKNVRLMSQYIHLPSGGNAQLEVGKNEDYVLPIIGELKELLSKPSHIIELEKVPQLKDALNQFIFENEELSDYSWIEVMWENEIKTRSVHVKFIFNYMNSGYCLLQHYYNNVLIGMERMNNVTDYVIRRKTDTTDK